MQLGLNVLLAAAALSFAAKRVKVNKYAKFSKADEVRKSLRFSNVDDVDDDKPSATAAEIVPPTLRNRSLWTYPDAALVDQRDPSTFGFTEVGIVLGAHGTRGELKILSDSDFARERLCTPGLTWLRRPRRRAPREVQLVSGRKGPGTNNWLVTLDAVSSREEAMALKGATLFVRRELRPETLQAGELMLWELEGLSVVRATRAPPDEGPARGAAAAADDAATGDAGAEAARWLAGEHVGTIIGVIPREELTGNPELGNDLLEIALGNTTSYSDDDEAYANEEDEDEDDLGDQIVVEIRLAERLVLLDPPEGLLDLIQPKRVERVVIRGLIPATAASLQEARERQAADGSVVGA